MYTLPPFLPPSHMGLLQRAADVEFQSVPAPELLKTQMGSFFVASGVRIGVRPASLWISSFFLFFFHSLLVLLEEKNFYFVLMLLN